MIEAILYAEVYLICILIVGLLLFWSVKSESRSASEQWLIRALTAFTCSFSANLLFTVFDRNLISIPLKIPVAYLFKTLFFLFFVLGTISWCGIVETEIRRDTPERRKIHLLLIGPSIPPLAAVLINPWTFLLFRLDETGRYTRGVMYHFLMLYLFAVTGFLAVRLLIRASREFSSGRRSQLRLTASFSLSILAAWVFSQVGELIPIICVCIMINLLCIYVSSSRQQISMDKLTQVNNRQNLIGFINYKLINHENRLYLLMIDVDYFKHINDTYGHLEGDRALVRVADALKSACCVFRRRPFIARYGGDEFIIAMEGTQEEANLLLESIREKLAESQEKEQAPYDLQVSIGVAGSRSGMMSKELIAAADEELYKIKQARDKKKAPK